MTTSPALGPRERSTKGKHVVLVEDDLDTGAAAAAALRAMGYRVTQASCGAHALRVLDDAPPDLFLVDLSLPDMSGIQFLEEKARRERARGKPVALSIVVSGDTDRLGDRMKWPAGVVGVLDKPFEPEDLFRAVEHALQDDLDDEPTRPRIELASVEDALSVSDDDLRIALTMIVPGVASWASIERLDAVGAQPVLACADAGDEARVLLMADRVPILTKRTEAGEVVRVDGRPDRIATPLYGARVLRALLVVQARAGRDFDRRATDRVLACARVLAAAMDAHATRETLAGALRAREDLLAVVCHDLRAPLTTISMTAANQLASLPAAPSQAAKDLDTILRSARHMRRMVQDLLDFSQLESARLRVDLRARSLSEIVEQAALAAQARARVQMIHIDMQPEAKDAKINCDRERLLQVLGNLLDNAVRYSPAGSAVTLRVRLLPRQVEIAVLDNGTGIPHDDLTHIFEPYRRGGGQRIFSAERSLGLGLTIAKGIVEAHGGTLFAESTVGKGTSLRFRLPLLEPAEDKTRSQTSVLLVDDDDALREEIGEAIAGAGYELLTATNGKRALEILREGARPSLVLLDLMMPIMSGWELLVQIKQDTELARIPVVVISCLDERRVEPTLIDIAAYLEKPMRVEELLDVVHVHAGAPA